MVIHCSFLSVSGINKKAHSNNDKFDYTNLTAEVFLDIRQDPHSMDPNSTLLSPPFPSPGIILSYQYIRWVMSLNLDRMKLESD